MNRPDTAKSSSSDNAPSTHHSIRPLLALALATLLAALGTSIANVALPNLATAFDASFGAAQWIVLAYLLAVTSSIVGAGRLGDRLGRRRLLLAGLLLFTAASALAGVAPNLGVLLLARAAQGLGAAVMMALSLALVGESVPAAKTGAAMGLLGTTSAIGTALGPSLGGLLVAGLGWPAIFLAEVPLGLVAWVLARRHLPADRPRGPAASFDVAGTVVLAASLGAYAFAITRDRGHLGALELGVLAAAAVGVAAFVRIESRAAAPLVQLSLLRDRGLAIGLASSLLVSTVVMATMIVGPFYLAGALGEGPGVVGLVMSTGPLVAALVGVPAGRMVDRIGSAGTTLAGLAAVATGAGLLAVTPVALGIAGYVTPLVLLTGGYALFQAANNTAVLRDVAATQRGVVSGALQLSRNLGLVTGASVMGAVFELATGGSDPTAADADAIAAGMHASFAVAGGLTVIALALVLGRRRGRAWVVAALIAALSVPSLAGAAERDVAAPASTISDPALVLRSADGNTSLRLLGLLQLELAHAWNRGAPDTDAFSIHRARLGLVGSVLRRELRYTLIADFAGAAPRLMFANLDVTLVRDWLVVRAGQFKRPFSRSFLTPGSELSLIDRPATVRAFGDDADLGVMLHGGADRRIVYAAGVFGGAGPNVVPERVHPLLAARVGYESRGSSPYSEGDLAGGPTRVGVAAAVVVDLDGDGGHAGSTRAVVDATFMARGVSLTAAAFARTAQRGAPWSRQRLDAIGHHAQLGVVIARRVEPVVRYALVQPIAATATHDLTGGLTVYARGHAIKWQTSVSTRLGGRGGRTATAVTVASQLGVAF